MQEESYISKVKGTGELHKGDCKKCVGAWCTMYASERERECVCVRERVCVREKECVCKRECV